MSPRCPPRLRSDSLSLIYYNIMEPFLFPGESYLEHVVVNGKRGRPRIARAASRRAGSSDASDRLFVYVFVQPAKAGEGGIGRSSLVDRSFT